MDNGWIGVDLDGTLARYDKWVSSEYIGPPITSMVERVKQWIASGQEVRIFTARVSPISAAHNGITVDRCKEIIREWCMEHIGSDLIVTHEKDYRMIAIYDDVAVHVVKNTGDVLPETSNHGLV